MGLRTVIRSSPGPRLMRISSNERRSSTTRSFPAPVHTKSPSLRPLMTSLPPRLTMTSAPRVPRIRSGNGVPRMVACSPKKHVFPSRTRCAGGGAPGDGAPPRWRVSARGRCVMSTCPSTWLRTRARSYPASKPPATGRTPPPRTTAPSPPLLVSQDLQAPGQHAVRADSAPRSGKTSVGGGVSQVASARRTPPAATTAVRSDSVLHGSRPRRRGTCWLLADGCPGLTAKGRAAGLGSGDYCASSRRPRRVRHPRWRRRIGPAAGCPRA